MDDTKRLVSTLRRIAVEHELDARCTGDSDKLRLAASRLEELESAVPELLEMVRELHDFGMPLRSDHATEAWRRAAELLERLGG